MPSIEISAEQAEALANGRNITIVAPKTERYIVVTDNGNVFDVLTKDDVVCDKRMSISITGECRLIAKGPHSGRIGEHTQSGIGAASAIAVKVPA